MVSGNPKFNNMGLMIEAEINDQNKLQQVHITPVEIRYGNPHYYAPEEREEACDYLKKLCAVIQKPEGLARKYYFTCRNNFDMHLNAALSFLLKKRKIKRFIDSVCIQFRPQIFRLRINLFHFLFSGDALKFERENNPCPVEFPAIFWQKICMICWLLGFSWFWNFLTFQRKN